MRNLFIYLRFIGTAYHGFQIQKNADTIAARLNEAIFKVTGEVVSVKGCSRTDTGVHALMYCAGFQTKSKIMAINFPRAINAYLPRDIAVYECRDMEAQAHPQYDTFEKEYTYKILAAQNRDPFYHNKAMFYPHKTDVDLLNEAAKEFIGTYDFTSFCNLGSTVLSNVRTVKTASVTRDGDVVSFNVCADGFLYNMIRIMVGTLLFVNEGKLYPSDIKRIIEAKNRKLAGYKVSPHGLYLVRVKYKFEE